MAIVKTITVERLFNLGNYENVKYGVTLELNAGDDPGGLLAKIAMLFEDLNPGQFITTAEDKKIWQERRANALNELSKYGYNS